MVQFPVRSNPTLLPMTRHRCDASVLPRHYGAEMVPAARYTLQVDRNIKSRPYNYNEDLILFYRFFILANCGLKLKSHLRS